MFLPWKDDNPTRRVAWVTIGLIVGNAAVFLGEFTSADPAGLFSRYGLVPARFLDGPGGAGFLTVFTSLFLHGSFLHLASNMLYLWIFGNNIEDVLGPVRFVLFYGLVGMGGHAAHLLTNAGSSLPTIGASGAIAGILGAYLLRYPHAKVHTFLYLIFLFGTFRVPAAVVIGVWFLAQILGGLGSLAGSGEGIAWFEHLGGFVTGAAIFPWLAGKKGRRVSRW